MKKHWKWLVTIVALASVLLLFGSRLMQQKKSVLVESASEQQQQDSSSEAVVKEKIDQLIKESHFQGSALLINQGRIFYQQAFGYADAKHKQLNKIDGVFPIASLQKMITGALILELVKEHELDLGTSLATFYPEVDFSQTITIQQLLSHNSGILMAEEEPSRLLRDQKSQLDNTINSLTVTPNKEFLYTNANYTLLAGIISKVTNEPYEQVVQDRIIKRLGLKHTYFWDHLPKDEVVPISYIYNGKEYQTDPFSATEPLFSSLLGAGNMYMSPKDFWTFIQGLADGRLFEQKDYERLAQIKNEGYQAGMIYFGELKYSEGSLGGYNPVIYGDQTNQKLVILFANQPASEGMDVLGQRLYQELLGI